MTLAGSLFIHAFGGDKHACVAIGTTNDIAKKCYIEAVDIQKRRIHIKTPEKHWELHVQCGCGLPPPPRGSDATATCTCIRRWPWQRQGTLRAAT